MLASPIHRASLALTVVCSALAGHVQAQTEGARALSPLGPGGTGFGHKVLLVGDELFVAEARSSGGAVHVYDLSSGSQTYVTTLTGSGSVAGDGFGVGLQRDGDLLVVGASGDPAFGAQAGAAYVFRRTNGQWLEEARLAPAQLETNDFFGRHVAVEGDRVLVSAGGDDDNGAQAGAAYAFEHSAGQWSLVQKVFPQTPRAGAFFGDSLAMDGALAVFGAGQDLGGGAAYVFEHLGGSWVQRQQLTNPGVGSYFGFRLDMEGTRLAIGALFGQSGGQLKGRVYIHDLVGGLWGVTGDLEPPDGSGDIRFSRALDVSGDRIVVGAPDHEFGPSGFDDGAAYLFEQVSGGWRFVTRLTPNDLGRTDQFGISVQLDGERILVGSSRAPATPGAVGDEGALYTFQWPNGVEHFCHCPAPLAPCGNADGGAGCRFLVAGAQLHASGSVGVAADDLALTARGIPVGAPTLLVLGDGRTSAVYADGLRCVGAGASGALFRFGVAVGDPLGTAAFGPGLVAASQSLPAVAHIGAGTTWNFQAVYRANGGPCGAGGNVTNAIAVTFVP